MWYVILGTSCSPYKIQVQPFFSIKKKKSLWYELINLKHTFEHFEQHYTHFHTLLHPYIYKKYSNNITQTPLPNTPKYLQIVEVENGGSKV